MNAILSLLLSLALLTLTGCIDGELTWEETFKANAEDSQENDPGEDDGTSGGGSLSVAITSHADGAVVGGPLVSFTSFAVSGTCSEPGGTVNLTGIHTESVTCAAGGTWGITADIDSLWTDGGSAVFQVTLTSGSETSSQHRVTLTRDSSATPASVTSAPAGNLIYSGVDGNGNRGGASFTFNCPEPGTISYSISVSGPEASGDPIDGSVGCSSAGPRVATINFSTLAANGETLSMNIGFTDSLDNVATAGSWSGTLDTIPPGAPSLTGMSNIDATDGSNRYTASTSISVSGSASGAVLDDVVRLYSNSTCTTQIATDTYNAFSGAGASLILTEDTTLNLYARVLDGNGNASACTFLSNVIQDSQPPSPPSGVTLAQNWTGVSLTTPGFSWTDNGDAGSGIARFEFTVGTTAGSDNHWSTATSLGAVTTAGGQTGSTPFTEGTEYYINVRAVDRVNRTSAWAASGAFRFYSSAPSAPSPLSFEVLSLSSIRLQWPDVSNEADYVIQWVPYSGGTCDFSSPQELTLSTNTSFHEFTGLPFRPDNCYRVQARNPLGESTWTNLIAGPRMDIMTAVEMVDVPLASSNISSLLFERTLSRVLAEAYTPAPEAYFEVVAENTGGGPYTVELVSNSGVSLASVSVTPTSGAPTRFTPVSFTLQSAPSPANHYRVRTAMTAGTGQLVVRSARILLRQTAALTTRVFIPLTAARGAPTEASVIDPTAAAFSHSGGFSSPFGAVSRFLYNSTEWSQLAGSPFELEVVAAKCSGGGSGSVQLYQLGGTPSPVSSSLINFSNPSPSLLPPTTISGSLLSGQQYELWASSGGGGQVCVYRAGLWVEITDLSRAIVPLRVGQAYSTSSAGNFLFNGQRLEWMADWFSNPEISLEAVGSYTSSLSSMVARLYGCGANNQSACTEEVSWSGLGFGSTPMRLRSTTIALTNGDRFIGVLESSGDGGTAELRSMHLMVQTAGQP